MENLDLYNKVREVPKEAQKPFNNGRFSGTDINPMWRIKKLTEEFGICGFGWYYEITDKWLEKGQDDIVAAFVNINLFIKIGEEWSKPIQGTGGNTFVSKNKNGYQVSDECYKMALTDAISVAAKALGVGADIYFSNDRTKYDTPKDTEPKQDPKATQKTDEPSDIIFEMINKADSQESLKDIWTSYPNYQRNQKFKNALTNAKSKLPKLQPAS
ncbi:hypothetical protein [Dysgonomonas mossii]|uniref:Uncharacterized protein n=4 Tax=Dysgonomonas mossii DSM 22836 TaxID=742767 RepID=F8X1E3_9BACT|nr:hypothetical protein [Dysgonomonas mossii]EGK03294.1 hypothetical protein HMPREF9456_02052 [Dysgonomonas mossii DSM 22836]